MDSETLMERAFTDMANGLWEEALRSRRAGGEGRALLSCRGILPGLFCTGLLEVSGPCSSTRMKQVALSVHKTGAVGAVVLHEVSVDLQRKLAIPLWSADDRSRFGVIDDLPRGLVLELAIGEARIWALEVYSSEGQGAFSHGPHPWPYRFTRSTWLSDVDLTGLSSSALGQIDRESTEQAGALIEAGEGGALPGSLPDAPADRHVPLH